MLDDVPTLRIAEHVSSRWRPRDRDQTQVEEGATRRYVHFKSEMNTETNKPLGRLTRFQGSNSEQQQGGHAEFSHLILVFCATSSAKYENEVGKLSVLAWPVRRVTSSRRNKDRSDGVGLRQSQHPWEWINNGDLSPFAAQVFQLS